MIPHDAHAQLMLILWHRRIRVGIRKHAKMHATHNCMCQWATGDTL